jgi:hypothetical protein
MRFQSIATGVLHIGHYQSETHDDAKGEVVTPKSPIHLKFGASRSTYDRFASAHTRQNDVGSRSRSGEDDG